MKNYGDLRECYPPWPTASTDNTLLDFIWEFSFPILLSFTYCTFIYFFLFCTLVKRIIKLKLKLDLHKFFKRYSSSFINC